MSNPLFVLIVEDNVSDFELIVNELTRFGLKSHCERVETEAAFAARLEERPDIILAEQSLSGFDNLRALEILHQSGLVIPFIVLTGSVSEDNVVHSIKNGAADYLLKDRILRWSHRCARTLPYLSVLPRKWHFGSGIASWQMVIIG